MTQRFLDLLVTPAVRQAQAANGSRAGFGAGATSAPPDPLGPAEAAFIAARDSFYMASVGETGWPYIQHRGGPPGFLRVLDERTLAFADFRGNRQYLSLGNTAANDRVALFLMDYPNQRRLKLLGRLWAVETRDDPDAAAPFLEPGYKARAERVFHVAVEAFDWNCPQHITPRFTEAELAPTMARVRAHFEQLEAENAALRAQLATLEAAQPS